MGRPAITTKDLPKDWDLTILSEMTNGASLVEIAALLEISRETLYQLCKRDQEFADTIKRGEQLSEAWWTREGRINLENKFFSATLWYMNMKNRFGWKDKSEIDHTSKGEQIQGFNYVAPNDSNNPANAKAAPGVASTEG